MKTNHSWLSQSCGPDRWVVLGLVAGLLLPGCAFRPAAPAGKSVYRVWPPSPAEPRVAYVQSIRSPGDVGARQLGGGNRMARWLFGDGKNEARLVRPFGLALDEAGNLCIADPGASRVCFLDRARKTWQSWNKIGAIELVSPVAVAKQTNVFYVADSELHKVLAFDGQGKLLFELAQPMERPAGLALTGSRLFVADSAAHRILVFEPGGKYLSSFGRRGTGPGEFNFPTHLTTDSQGRLFVTDSMNFRIQIFDADGHYEKEIGRLGDSSGTLSRPKGVAVDLQGNLYVVDALFENVQIFDQAGGFLLTVGENGDGPGEFWLPTGIAVDRDGRIYVADAYNRRIQVLQLLPPP
jgi:DNA-binding beta-propeller fold protein YncE